MEKDYMVQYKNGATVTVFAPYDCENNCPFCVNKKDYEKNSNDFNIYKVICSMYKIGSITPSCDFVITGGEPFADLYLLQLLINSVRKMNNRGHHHKLFINTTFPISKYTEQEMLAFVENNKDIITGLNVSRHIKKYVKECDDKIFNDISVPVRINCVLFRPKEALEAYKLYKRFINKKSINGIQFREDYTTITEDNLYKLDINDTFRNVCNSFNEDFKELFTKNLIFMNDFRWNCKIFDKVSYHRTLPYSKINKGNKVEINDIIINTKGIILDDWNEYGNKLNLKKYSKCFTLI